MYRSRLGTQWKALKLDPPDPAWYNWSFPWNLPLWQGSGTHFDGKTLLCPKYRIPWRSPRHPLHNFSFDETLSVQDRRNLTWNMRGGNLAGRQWFRFCFLLSVTSMRTTLEQTSSLWTPNDNGSEDSISDVSCVKRGGWIPPYPRGKSTSIRAQNNSFSSFSIFRLSCENAKANIVPRLVLDVEDRNMEFVRFCAYIL